MDYLHFTRWQPGTEIKGISKAPRNWQDADAEIPQVAFSQALPLTTPWRMGAAARTVSFKRLVAHLEQSSCRAGWQSAVLCQSTGFGPQSSVRV